jgi:ATP-binding cassette subfamily F protein uup
MATYLEVENITRAYGEKTLFESISLRINEGQKVALIAKNGAGKTTLLNVIAGKERAAADKIYINPDIVSEYLMQEPELNEANNILMRCTHLRMIFYKP